MARMGSVSKPVLKRMSDVMPFGEFKGKTVRYILDIKPSYIIWLKDENVADVSDEIWNEAQELDYEEGYDYPDWMDEPF